MIHFYTKLTAFGLACFFLAGFYACATTGSYMKVHPVEVTEAPICSECHEGDKAALNHTPDYELRHRFYAEQRSQVCNLCHKESFCSDCHANKEELKPSDKFKDSPKRSLPHRGDYLTQHRIDGRINPAPCLKCHGRNNNARCRACHK
jgi:hypothetical protein